MVDFFGRKAQIELEALRASSASLDMVRREEIQRLGSLLQSTIMKLLALTDRDAFRVVQSKEGPPIVQGAIPNSPFLRRGSAATALRKSKEASINALAVSE